MGTKSSFPLAQWTLAIFTVATLTQLVGLTHNTKLAAMTRASTTTTQLVELTHNTQLAIALVWHALST